LWSDGILRAKLSTRVREFSLKMKQISVLLLISLLFISSSCTRNERQCQFVSFHDHAWNRFEKQKFEIPVRNISSPSELKLILRHTNDYPFDNLYINVITEMPGGEERIMEKDLRLKDASGNFLSDDRKGYHEISFTLYKELRFTEKGLCRVEIENLIPKIEIPGILELGLCLQKPQRDQGKQQ